jgi:hypothetical protein
MENEAGAEGRAESLPETMNVRAARDAYLAENGFHIAEYVADTATIRAFGHDFTIPNPRERKRAIPFHDLHHVATGYGTDLIGEAEASAWELAAGCPKNVVLAINLGAMMLGLLLAPSRIVAAFRTGLAQKTLYGSDYGALLGESVGELRARLGMPSRGVARYPRKLHEAAPRIEARLDIRV